MLNWLRNVDVWLIIYENDNFRENSNSLVYMTHRNRSLRRSVVYFLHSELSFTPIPRPCHFYFKICRKMKLNWPRCQDCSCVFLPTRSVVRLAASLLTKLVDSLAPSITSVLVHGKQVSGHTDRRVWLLWRGMACQDRHFNVH